MDFRFDIIYEYREIFLYGVLTTPGLIVIGTLDGSTSGLLLALARLIHLEKAGVVLHAAVRLVRKISLLHVTLFRGTSLFVQIIAWAYVWFPILVHPVNGTLLSGEEANELCKAYGPLIIGSLALIANSGTHINEVFRAGIQSINKGQMEAARSLGLNYRQAMRYVVLPQALRRMLPPPASEFITLLKDGSLLFVIGVVELLAAQKAILGRHSVYEESLYMVVLIYLVLTIRLDWISLRLENRYNQPRR